MSDAKTTVLAQSEKPLDRLNYFNGQRLEASDLKLEQQYHIRVRRWLNKSLYTTGIARGLEVVAQDPGNSTNVIVSPGLALDSEGREIILLDQVSIPVVGTPSTTPGVVDGNYLTIQYNEQATEEEQDGCVVQPGNKNSGCGKGSKLAWGGPAFLRAQPILGFTDYLPSDTSGKIVLAQIELDDKCNVVSAHPEVRRYVGAASAAKVYQYALEGEREISSGDGVNPATESYTVIYFHIRGREPNSVTLYLRADTFPTLHYTEMGEHTHGLSQSGSVTTSPPTYPEGLADPRYQHSHTVPGQNISGGDHTGEHGLFLKFAEQGVADGWLRVWGVDGVPGAVDRWDDILRRDPVSGGSLWFSKDKDSNRNPLIAQITGGVHSHTVSPITSDPANPFLNDDHTHTIPAVSMGSAGVTDPNFPNGPYSAHSGAPLTYVNELRILIDGVDQTANILTQLNGSNPADYPIGTKLGDGTSSHPLVQHGTGPIKLDFLPQASFTEDVEQTIEIHSTPTTDANGNTVPTGGRILYNLYVE